MKKAPKLKPEAGVDWSKATRAVFPNLRPSLDPIILEKHLKMLEQRLLRPEVRKSPAEVGALLADDFVEFASDGRVCGKAQIIESLRKSPAARMTLSDFKVRMLAPDVALATFRYHRESTPERPAARSIRSSVWKRTNGRWRMAFHQGTLSNP